MSKQYDIKYKYLCSVCGSNHDLLKVEEKSIVYPDECRLMVVCRDCLMNLEDYQDERGE